MDSEYVEQLRRYYEKHGATARAEESRLAKT